MSESEEASELEEAVGADAVALAPNEIADQPGIVEAVIPEDIRRRYEIYSYRSAALILAQSHPQECADLFDALRTFEITTTMIRTAGGNESEIPKLLSRHLRPLGWHETIVQGDLLVRLLWREQVRTTKGGKPVMEPKQREITRAKFLDAILHLSQQRMAAAEQLQARTEAEADPARKTELERSLATLVQMLEQMAPDLDREKQDAADANDFLRTLEEAYAQAGQKLKSARDALNRAQRDMGRAAQQRDVAERRAEAAREAAGLTNATSGLSVALKAMQDNAAHNLAEAEAANAKTKLLQPSRPEQEDPNIAEAMRAASGAGPAPSTLGDRLAALRQRQLVAPTRQLGGPQGD